MPLQVQRSNLLVTYHTWISMKLPREQQTLCKHLNQVPLIYSHTPKRFIHSQDKEVFPSKPLMLQETNFHGTTLILCDVFYHHKVSFLCKLSLLCFDHVFKFMLTTTFMQL